MRSTKRFSSISISTDTYKKEVLQIEKRFATDIIRIKNRESREQIDGVLRRVENKGIKNREYRLTKTGKGWRTQELIIRRIESDEEQFEL